MLLQYKEEKWGFAGRDQRGNTKTQDDQRTSTNDIVKGRGVVREESLKKKVHNQ